MSYPASRNRHRRRPNNISSRGGMNSDHRRALLDNDHINTRLERSRSPRGHVELLEFGDSSFPGIYQPPRLLLQDDVNKYNLPVVEGLVVHGVDSLAAPQSLPMRSLPLSSPHYYYYYANADNVNVNPAQDLANPCTSRGCLCCPCVRTQQVGIVENCGAFDEIVGPGLVCLPWPWRRLSHRLSLRIQQLDVVLEVNTADKVFCHLKLSVLFRVSLLHAYEACYALQNVRQTLESLVVDTLRSTVTALELDHLFSSRSDIVNAIFHHLYHPLRNNYGYELCSVLLTHIEPNAKVRLALNAVPTARRQKQAALHQAEAVWIEKTKAAEAAVERSFLHGVGVARQRSVLAESLSDSTQAWMDDVYIQGPTHKQIMELLLVTQYMDVLVDVKGDHLILPLGG